MTRDARLPAALALLLLLLPAPAAAAQGPDPVAEAPMRIGIFGVAPRIAVTSLGVDTNVFNEVEDPRQDFTAAGSIGADVWMRAGRGLFSFTGQSQFTYFREFASERSVGGLGSVGYEHRFNRLRPFVTYAASNTRQRPGHEIDARVRSITDTWRAGAALRVGPETDFEVAVRRETVTYEADAVFEGRRLNEALNRTLEAVDLTWRQRLTVLTTWVVRASGEQERFELSTERHNDSVRVSTGFELGRFALIRGNAFAGYRRLTAAGGGTMPEYAGLTTEVGVTYSAPTRTRIQVEATRDLEYSFEILEPYYVQTGVRGTLTQRVAGNWDLQVHGGQDRLRYRSIVAPEADGRLDRIDRLGGGLGYQAAPEFRVGINVESFYRKSEIPGRNYRGLRAGLVANYGF